MKSDEIPRGEPKRIQTKKIKPNPENPRLIFDELEGEDSLKESIRQVGILVPLIVYQESASEYILLDGERRWRCAKELNLETVPANIIGKPTPLENILRMFNIHQLRKPWSIIETAWKLQRIMKLTGETGEPKLAQLTGMKRGDIRRLKILLQFPTPYQKMIYNHILRSQRKDAGQEGIKSDFFIEMFPILNKIQKNYHGIFSEYGYKLIDLFIKKYRSKLFVNVTDFRLLRKVLNAPNRSDISEKKIADGFRTFLESDSLSVRAYYEQSVSGAYDFQRLSVQVTGLTDILGRIIVATVSQEERRRIRIQLQTLVAACSQIMSKL